MKMLLFTSLLLATSFTLGQPDQTPLEWTSSDGRKIMAPFVRVQDDSVVIWLNGTTTKIPFDQLKKASVKQARKLAKSTAPASSVKTTFSGMTLAPDWLPDRVGVDKLFMDSLRFYSDKAVADKQRGDERAPKKIYGPITWLMPMDEAVHALGRVSKTSESRITNQAFPKDSFTMVGLQGEFEDRHTRYNQIFLIGDVNRKVVSVQLVAQTPREQNWAGGPEPVRREPYYGFVTEKRNGSSGNSVFYQVIHVDPGLKLIKMVLTKGRPNMKWLEDVQWYLPAPVAGRFLDIADHLASQK